MKKSLSKSLLSFAFAAAIAAGVAAPGSVDAQTLNTSDYPNAPRIPNGGKTYTVVQGSVWEVQGPLLVWVQRIYDPAYQSTYYQTVSGTTYRIVNGTTFYPVLLSMNEGFENASTIRDLVGPTHGFTTITLQSPLAPTVAQYVALRQSILNGTGTFLDNRIEPSPAQAHTGTQSLRAYAVPAGGGTTVSKASVESELMHFVKGDDLWFSGWFYIAQGTPTGIVDFETSFVLDDPGLRVLMDSSLRPRIELKWGNKPTYLSSAGTVFPVRKWFHLQVHAFLSEGTDGRVEMWLDGKQVIAASGQTLPMPDILYDRLEIGITANETTTSEVFVDDMKVAKQPVS